MHKVKKAHRFDGPINFTSVLLADGIAVLWGTVNAYDAGSNPALPAIFY